MIPKYAQADLVLVSIAPQSGIVKHTKFDHVLDTIFCAFWTESVHRAPLFMPHLILQACKAKICSEIQTQPRNQSHV